MRDRRRLLLVLAVVGLLVEMAVGMVTAATQQTPTVDEPVYVGTAVVYMQEHSLRYNAEHPPLGKLVMAAGLAFTHINLDRNFDGTQGDIGRHLLYESGNDPWRLMLLARLPVIVLTLLFGLVVFAFATDLVGPAGGLVALALYAFSPDLVANGSQATLDVMAAGFVLTAVWLIWRARDRRPRLYLALAALATGAAMATKMSTLPAVPVLLGLILLSMWKHGWRRAVLAASGVAIASVATVWVSYLVVDPSLHWVPKNIPQFGGIHGIIVKLMPFPAPYRDGMRIQFGFEKSTFGGFLFGHQYTGPRWYYLPVALLVKTPIGALVLWLCGTVALFAVPRLRAAAPYLLAPAGILLLSVLNEARDFGVRYAIFTPMFLAVVASALVAVRRRWAYALVATMVAYAAVSSMLVFPYYMAYSNEAFGGAPKTYTRLHDSNVDWGQDLGRLADRLRERYPGQKVWLIYKGAGVPSWYGIQSSDPMTVPPDQVRGLLVVSDDSIDKAGPTLNALLSGAKPIDEVGYSITIFRR